MHDDDYSSQNADHDVRPVWAKAPGVICLLLPRHQGDDDEVIQVQVHGDDDDYEKQGQSDLKMLEAPCLVKIMMISS